MKWTFMQLHKAKPFVVLSLISAGFLANTAQAWNHEISAGYGWGQEVGEQYGNQTAIVYVTFYKFGYMDKRLFATIEGTYANLNANAPTHQSIDALALSLAGRAYAVDPQLHKIRPYAGLSFGPAYISHTQLGNRRQGTHYIFQSMFVAGIEFGLPRERSIDIGLHMMHYCNADLARPNEGINVRYAVTVGYQF